MNKQRIINNHLSILDSSFHFKENVIKVNSHNNLKHELAKFLLCFELINNGFKVYTEVIFKNGKRADIFEPFSNHAYEIINSESKLSIEKKKLSYPCNVSFLKADDIIRDNRVVLR